jgi:hypothetical protein
MEQKNAVEKPLIPTNASVMKVAYGVVSTQMHAWPLPVNSVPLIHNQAQHAVFPRASNAVLGKKAVVGRNMTA